MELSEKIRQAREAKGFSQEALAEQLNLSRQSISKWELGASVPSPENLEALAAVLEVEFAETPPVIEVIPSTKRRRWIVGAIIGVVLLAGLLLGAAMMFAEPSGPAITAIRFYDETGTPLHPDPGDNWNVFDTPEQGSAPITMVVSFQNGRSADVNAVSVFFTPSGTETFDQREQWHVQAVEDGLDYALFVLGLRRDLMGELEVRLECGGGIEISEFLNVTTYLP